MSGFGLKNQSKRYIIIIYKGLLLEMVAQLSLNLGIVGDTEVVTLVKKRKRYKIPTYKKFYSVWQYDRNKFRALLNIHLENIATSPYKNQEEILNECFIRDEKGLKLRDCDEVHIFRAGVLERIYEKIFDYTGVMFVPNPGAGMSFKTIKKHGLIIYPCEGQAEIAGTWQGSIKERIKLHIKLLRLLRGGFSVREAVDEVKNAQNKTGAPGHEKAIRKQISN